MSEPRKHHYVPQLYLKNFSYANGKNAKLNVLSLSQNKIYPASVCDSAAERDFYTVDNELDKYIWERHYANRIEPMLDELLKNIRARCENALILNHATIINSDEKIRLALSLVFQLLRGKQTRAYEKKLYDNLLPKVQSQAREVFSPLTKAQEERLLSFAENDKYFKDIAMETIFREDSIRKYLDILFQRTFIFYRIIGKDYSFITSDNPVMLVDATTHDATPFKHGIVNAPTLIYYPISPQLLLGAYHPDIFLGVLSSHDRCLEIIDGHKEKNFILSQNRLQKSQCHNYIYSQTRAPLESLLDRAPHKP